MKKINFLLVFLLFHFLINAQVSVTNFTLVNAETDEDLFELKDGMQISLTDLPTTFLNIRANTDDGAESVSFLLSGVLNQTQTENKTPYALYGDQSGNYKGQSFSVGDYTLTASSYSEDELNGEIGNSLTIDFSLVSGQRPFITTWKTDNPGLLEDNQITIPTRPGQIYNYNIDWGDGSSDENINGNIIHSYDTPGIYTVSISGNFPAILFANSGVEEKLLEVNQWGSIKWKDMSSAFSGCKNIDITTLDAPDLSLVENLSGIFTNCTSLIGNESFETWDTSTITLMRDVFGFAENFNQDISDWDVSNVISMRFMFVFASSFNQDISKWDVSNVEDMSFMFQDCAVFDYDLSSWNVSNVDQMVNTFTNSGLSDENYNKTLIGWNQLPLLQDGVTLDAPQNQYCEAAEARQSIIDTYSWSINDAGKVSDCGVIEQRPFITTWKTDNPGTSGDNQIIIPTEFSFNYDYSVDWGDGTFSMGLTGDAEHSYDTPGTYVVSIFGNFPMIFMANSGEEEKLLEVNQWGDIVWQAFFGSFFNCKNLDIAATDIPNLTQVELFGSTFTGCESLVWNSSVNDWDVSNATSLFNLFNGAKLFNQDISKWDVSNVTTFVGLFGNTSLFNQDLSSWDVSKAERMNSMFWNATSYNQSMEEWDISQVTEFAGFLENSGLSNENYDKTLIGWSELPALQNEVQLDAPQNKYCLSEEARQNIIDTYGWTINDAGLFCEDTTAPELTLIGGNPLVIVEGSVYDDPGATAEDNIDGDITNNIIIAGDTVDSNTPSTYMVTYNVMDAAGNAAEEKVREVLVEPAQNMELSVTGFSLVDAENDMILFPITEGMAIDVNTLPTMNLSIIAIATNDTESVALDLTGAKNVQTIENVAPYALFGDVVPDYRGEKFDLGEYTISATPYSDNKLTGSAGIPLSLNFSIQEADPICTGFEITITNQQNPTTCNGNEGLIDFDIIGAALPVSYEMDGLVEAQSSSLFDGLSAGKYLVLVTDANNCSETLTVTLEDPAIPEVTLEPIDTILDTDVSFQLTGGMPLGGVYSGEGVNDNGFFDPSLVVTGTYEITYTFIDSVTDCSNSATQSFSVSSVNVNTVTGFVLVNAYTNTDIMTLTEGLSIEISDLPTTNLNIRAETTEDVESALLQITGNLTNTRTENVAPYAFYGDINSNYYGKVFGEGDYTITATPYSDDKLSGEVGSSKTINFSINSSDGVSLKAMNIYPNPANAETRASFDNMENNIEKIMIFDMLGRLVQVYEGNQIKEGNTYLLNVEDISVGTYFIKTEDAKGNQYQKQIVIQR